MTLIELLNEYDGEGLTATEQAVYFNLCLIWNKLRRPDWFAVSRAELMRKAGIGGDGRLTKAINGLEQKQFILSQSTGRTSPRKYRLIPQATPKMGQATSPKIGQATPKMGQAENPLPPKQGKHLPHFGAKLPPKWGTSQSTEYLQSTYSHSTKKDTTTNLYKSPGGKMQSSNLNSIGVQATEQDRPEPLPQVDEKVLTVYQQEIRPICSPFELERLADDVERYGSDIVIKAIQRATMRNKHNLQYVEAILQGWAVNGYDEAEGGNHNHDNVAGNSGQGESADEWADRLAREYNLGG